MVIDAPQKDRVATGRGQIRFCLRTLDHGNVTQIPFLDLSSQRLEFLSVDLSRKHFPRCANRFARRKRIDSISRADVRHDHPRFPLHERRKLWNFIRGRGHRMQRESKGCRGCTTEPEKNPFFRSDFSIHGQIILLLSAHGTYAKWSSVFSNVLVPERRILRDEYGEHLHTFFRRKIKHFDSVFLQPIDSAAKIYRFSDDHRSNSKLANQPAAIPAWRERRDHDFVAVTFLAAGFPEGVGLAMRRRVTVLYSPVVAAPQKLSSAIEKRRTDWNSALRKSTPRFVYRRLEHL